MHEHSNRSDPPRRDLLLEQQEQSIEESSRKLPFWLIYLIFACQMDRPLVDLLRRPGVYSKLHGLQNFREGLVSLEEGATMDAIVARIRSSLTGTSPSDANTAVAVVAEVRDWGDEGGAGRHRRSGYW